MKNIYEILKDFGIEVPEEKKEDFNKSLHENYKTISEFNGINSKLEKANTEKDNYKAKYDEDIKSRDNDLAELKKQLEQAGADVTKIEELTNQLSTLQENYNNAQTDYQKQLAAQKYEFAVKEKVNELKFTSNSAKKAFLNDAIAKSMPMENDTILGFQDFVNAYKEQDAGAFVVEDDNNGGQDKKKPKFSGSSSNVDNDDKGGEDKPLPQIW